MQLTNRIHFRNLQLTNRIHFRNLRGDIFGGVTNAIVSLPIALAFGVASGLGSVAGLYGSICVGFFASLFGGTPTQISEPTGPTTVFMTAIIGAMIAKNPALLDGNFSSIAVERACTNGTCPRQVWDR